MKRLLLAFSLISALMVVSCDESIYPDFIADKDSEAARTEALEIAIDEGDFNYIINELESGDYSKTPARHKYLLQCAWLGKSGFSSIRILADVLDNPDNSNILALLMGGDSQTLTRTEIGIKKGYYADIVRMNNAYNTEGDNDIKTVAAISSMLGMAMAVTEVLPGCDPASLDKDSPDYIGACINGNTAVIVGQMDQAELDNYLATMEDLANSPDLADDGFKNELKEFINEVKDPGPGVDQLKLAEYLEKAFPVAP